MPEYASAWIREVASVPVDDPEVVVTDTALLLDERLPAASSARTVNEYAVEADRPVAVYVRLVVVPITAPPRSTSYPVTPTLSVDADQASVVADDVVPDAASPVGVDGAVVSPPLDADVVTETAVLLDERLPAASSARTVNE
jgi:hypothetical protein